MHSYGMSPNVSPAYHRPGSTDGYIITTDHPYVAQNTTHPYDVTHRHNTTLQEARALILTVLAKYHIPNFSAAFFAGN
jgi:hypothetical protein